MVAEPKALTVVPRTPHALTSPAEPDIFRVGEALARSGYFQDARDAAQAVVKVIAGRELGIGDVQAMTGIYIVKGRVTLSANLMAALVKRSGRYNYRVVEMTEQRCEIEFFEGSEACGKSAFTIEDARRAGTQNLDRFPRNMLFARAMSNGVRWFCPDVTTTPVYTPDELGAQVDGESGEVIEAEPAQPTPASTDEDALRRQKRAGHIAEMGSISLDGDRYKVTTPYLVDKGTVFEVWRDTDGLVRCTCTDFATVDDTRYRCEHILAVKHAVLNKMVQETPAAEPAPEGAPAEEPARPEESAGASREQLLEHVTALCVELGYDTKLQLEARSKAAKLSDEDIRKKAIGSLDRLIAQKRSELAFKIVAELERMGLDEEQMAGYVGANGGQGKKLSDCSLSEMRLVAVSLELQ